jgi:hypothetical protein
MFEVFGMGFEQAVAVYAEQEDRKGSRNATSSNTPKGHAINPRPTEIVTK